MNRLQDIGPDRSGLYRAPTDLRPLKRSLAAAGIWRDIDLSRVRTKGDLLETIARASDFPATFGCNWDALADILQDRSWRPAGAYVLNLQHAAGAARALGEDWFTLLEVLTVSAMYWRDRGELYIVLVDGTQKLPRWK